MPLDASITKELLFAYFAGQATALQKQRIEDWLTDPANEAFFYGCVHEWELKNPQYMADVNQAIDNFHQHIASIQGLAAAPIAMAETKHPGTAALATAALAISYWPAWLVAASLALLLGLSIALFPGYFLYKTYRAGYGEMKRITLPDGSKATLNANSELIIPRIGFGKSSRLVSLRGEANFAVVHTPDHKRFIVQTDNLLKIEVLGTEFNVFARERATKVGVYKGKVKVLYKQPAQQAKSLIMTPGDLVVLDINKRNVAVKKVLHPENLVAWQQGRFIFENTSLTEIKNMLQENYGLQVSLKGPGLRQLTVSGSFKANSANELLQALSETLNINVIRQDNRVLLSTQ